ncbi:MAG TPA: DUF1127 domain-containing protein [Arenibaculum sp.]|nr:DUF1127 domain-containing protein [Arenibaculum sp.]
MDIARHSAWGQPARIGQRLLAAIDLLFDWQDRRRQRRHLAGLPDELLRDIGRTRADVEREVSKPFWRG